jgi:hypothetical protein
MDAMHVQRKTKNRWAEIQTSYDAQGQGSSRGAAAGF